MIHILLFISTVYLILVIASMVIFTYLNSMYYYVTYAINNGVDLQKILWQEYILCFHPTSNLDVKIRQLQEFLND